MPNNKQITDVKQSKI